MYGTRRAVSFLHWRDKSGTSGLGKGRSIYKTAYTTYHTLYMYMYIMCVVHTVWIRYYLHVYGRAHGSWHTAVTYRLCAVREYRGLPHKWATRITRPIGILDLCSLHINIILLLLLSLCTKSAVGRICLTRRRVLHLTWPATVCTHAFYCIISRCIPSDVWFDQLSGCTTYTAATTPTILHIYIIYRYPTYLYINNSSGSTNKWFANRPLDGVFTYNANGIFRVR
jgi:hypothetical protein